MENALLRGLSNNITYLIGFIGHNDFETSGLGRLFNRFLNSRFILFKFLAQPKKLEQTNLQSRMCCVTKSDSFRINFAPTQLIYLQSRILKVSWRTDCRTIGVNTEGSID